MKTLLLISLLITGFLAGAQETAVKSNSCEAYFKYEINTKVMSLVPATAFNFYGFAKTNEGVKISYFWDFGDGTQSQEQNPMHVYIHPTPGPLVKISPYRTVSLTILTSDSCKSFYSEQISIMEGYTYPDTLTGCKAEFKYYQTGYDSIRGTATFQTTNRALGDSLSYLWTFDNGKTSTEKEPAFTYDIKPSEHKLCLTVTGPNGCTDTFCDIVYVKAPDKPAIEPVYCKAAFGYKVNYTIKTFAPALVLDFMPYSDPNAVEWKWDFGDGTTSNEAKPTHIFNLPISKDSILASFNPFRKVCLTVVTSSGCVASYCQTINIYMGAVNPDKPEEETCMARFKYYRPDLITIPELVPFQFNDASEGKIIARKWQFENGTTSTLADPQVNFDAFKPTQKVCLTIYTDSCSDTYCETVYVSGVKGDSAIVYIPSKGYSMRYTSSFPPHMSSCAGYVKAEVYLNGLPIKADNYSWSHGAQGQEVKGLCPTQIYSVKAIASDGTIVSGTFQFNSNGTVTEAPVNWWVSGVSDNPAILNNVFRGDYSVEWKLCDGTIVKSDSIPMNSINCGTEDATLILKDASGNVVYTENLSMKTMITGNTPKVKTQTVKVFPNPVNEVLNIQYSGNQIEEMTVEISDMTGRIVLLQKMRQVDSGQNISLNVNSLKRGLYVCKLFSGKQVLGIEKITK